MESTAAPSRACPTPRARSTESTAAPWRAVQLHGRSMESTGAGRGVHFGASGGGVSRNRRRFCGGFCGGRHFRRRRLPKQAALLRRLLRRPPLPAAAPPETGGASAAASAAAGASRHTPSTRSTRRMSSGSTPGTRRSTPASFPRGAAQGADAARCASGRHHRNALVSLGARRAYPCPVHVHALSMHRPHPRTILSVRHKTRSRSPGAP